MLAGNGMTFNQKMQELAKFVAQESAKAYEAGYTKGREDHSHPSTSRGYLMGQHDKALAVLDARIDENQRWANGYAQSVIDHPDMDDPATMFAAKSDFEARIKVLRHQQDRIKDE